MGKSIESTMLRSPTLRIHKKCLHNGDHKDINIIYLHSRYCAAINLYDFGSSLVL